MRRPTAYWSCLATLAAAIALATSTTAPAASSSTVVISAYVPSATNLSATGCATGSAGRTDFGTVLPGTTALTNLDCTIQFGSSNDTARLRVAQQDGRGVGMYQTTRGTLDTTFDTDGLVTTAIAPGTSDDTPRAIAVQADGRIIAVGYCPMAGTGYDACLARYNTNGSLDTTFDTDGVVTTATAAGGSADYAQAAVLQADGRIVTGGTCNMGATFHDSCLARYNTDGSLDTSFDTDGRVTTATGAGASYDGALAIAVQADGRIVTAGMCSMGATGGDICLARYNTNGSLDTSFDTDGRVTTAIAPTNGYDEARSIALQVDGRIVVSGYCNMGGATGYDACLARYNTDGSLDTTFDGDGLVTTAIAPGTGDDRMYGLALQTDGRIIATGNCDMGGVTSYDMCIARYNANGSLDATFDSDGIVTTNVSPINSWDTASSTAIQADGRIIVAGDCYSGVATGEDACLVRYNTDGSLDTTFDGDGRLISSTAPGASDDYVYAVALQTDGRIVTAGTCETGGATAADFCVTQYDNAGSMSQYADTVTDWDTVGTNMFGACLRSVTSATAVWTTSATCPTTDGAYWNAVPTTATQIATATPNTTTATAQLRFGMRTTLAQPPGSYIAPITFDVLAP